ncbi:MAG TPA: ABC transporter substrate-binding protein, partial [Dehalococcoidia bacterium]|nr:ABC transporter substrate-binding protein [Dehalococcoidia bacterium]
MSQTGYWQRFADSRASRRKLLQAGSAAGLGAVALGLLGCGSDGDSGGGDSSKLVTPPTDTSAKAIQGGIFQGQVNSDPNAFDVITGTLADVPHPARVYSRIIKYQSYKYPDPVQGVAAPDAATSWETSPDGLQITYKMRQGLKFDPQPPTNGRFVTAQDAKSSADRFMTISTQRAVLSNKVSPEAPIVSTEAPDDRTLVFKLAYPYAPLNMIIAAWRYIVVMPVEVDGKFDIKTTMRGSGAWRLKDYARSAFYEYVKNPDWYDADKIKLAGKRYAVLADVSANMAQFRTGNLWTYALPQEDVLPLKKDVAAMVMQAQEEFSAGGAWIRFGYLPGSPFLDERVRQAASMSLDRDLVIKTFGNVDKYEKEGINVPMRYNSAIFAGETFWIDPKDKKAYGDSAKYFEHNPAEAKKLLSAAGHNGAISTKFHWPSGTYGGGFDPRMQVLHGMWQDSGNFKLEMLTYPNYNTDFQPNFANASNKWEGIAASITAARPEVDVLLNEYAK